MTTGAAAQPSLIRARMSGAGTALLRLRMRHAMENGQRHDADGRPVPAWYIREFTLSLNGQALLRGQFGGGISKDPFLELTLRGAKAGDRLQLDWTDTQGAQRSDRAEVLA